MANHDERWAAVDDYIERHVVGAIPEIEAALEASRRGGLPQIQVSAAQGKFLFLLARMLRARRILEIGTLGGVSAIWMARALGRGGRLVSLEINPDHAAVALASVVAAGFGDRIDIRVGPATQLLAGLRNERREPFDLVFIDADKPPIADYFLLSLDLCHEGSVIVVDNVVRDGKLADGSSDDPNVIGVRRLHELLATEPRVAATTIQTVGSKGYDGFTLAVVHGDRRTRRKG